MKVLYDGNIFDLQRAGGINRYFANLIDHLPAPIEPVLVTYAVPKVNFPVRPDLKICRLPLFEPQRLARRLGRYSCRLIARWEQPAVVHPTYYHSIGVRRLNSYGCPSVITIYDFIHDLFPAQLDPHGTHRRAQNQAIEDADAVLCISNHTRADLLERLPHVEAKVRVVHLAAELQPESKSGGEKVPERPYFLYVGARVFYKNFAGLARAFALLNNLDCSLAVVGAPFDSTETRLLHDLGIASRVENLGAVTDSQLARLYERSLALIYPSHYEGFGIPPLEAMQCGAPVIAANNSSLPEVVGEAALLFDSRRDDELTDLLAATLAGKIDRDGLIFKGRQRAALFDWKKTAAQTAEIYRELAAP